MLCLLIHMFHAITGPWDQVVDKLLQMLARYMYLVCIKGAAIVVMSLVANETKDPYVPRRERPVPARIKVWMLAWIQQWHKGATSAFNEFMYL